MFGVPFPPRPGEIGGGTVPSSSLPPGGAGEGLSGMNKGHTNTHASTNNSTGTATLTLPAPFTALGTTLGGTPSGTSLQNSNSGSASAGPSSERATNEEKGNSSLPLATRAPNSDSETDDDEDDAAADAHDTTTASKIAAAAMALLSSLHIVYAHFARIGAMAVADTATTSSRGGVAASS